MGGAVNFTIVQKVEAPSPIPCFAWSKARKIGAKAYTGVDKRYRFFLCIITTRVLVLVLNICSVTTDLWRGHLAQVRTPSALSRPTVPLAKLAPSAR